MTKEEIDANYERHRRNFESAGGDKITPSAAPEPRQQSYALTPVSRAIIAFPAMCAGCMAYVAVCAYVIRWAWGLVFR